MSAVVSRPAARANAIGDLLAALEALVTQYQSLSESEREQRWSSDAERVTGEVARLLDVARSRVGPVFIAPASTTAG